MCSVYDSSFQRILRSDKGEWHAIIALLSSAYPELKTSELKSIIIRSGRSFGAIQQSSDVRRAALVNGESPWPITSWNFCRLKKRSTGFNELAGTFINQRRIFI